MSEDDRAAKAARAKALLKKRQHKKAADSATAALSSGVASPVSPPRTLSPAQSEPVEEDVRDLGEIFSKDTSDTSWLSSLPRVVSPPPPRATTTIRYVSANPPAPAPASPEQPPHTSFPSLNSKVTALEKKVEDLSKENESLSATVAHLKAFESTAQQAEASFQTERRRVEELNESYQKLQKGTEIALENERRTVSLLVTEKAHLTSELQKLEDFESKAQVLEDSLETERAKSDDLSQESLRLQTEVKELSRRAEQLAAEEKELLEHNKEQERQLQIVSASASESRTEADEFQRKLRELEEQVHSDDRVERLENSLKHTQDRADELEFQLTKVKQTHTSLKSERDGLESKVREFSTKEAEWTSKISSLDTQLVEIHEQLSTVQKERNELAEEKSRLHQLSETNENRVKDLQEKLAQAASAVATSAKQMQSTQNELKNAIRRAEDAEKTQKSLQAEGTNLMQALDEMRPKIVELTAAKLDLAEKVESLEHAIRSRDSTISQLENDLGEAKDVNEQAEHVWKERLAQQEKRHADMQNGTMDMQKAYTELQEELDTALASLRNLESQRTNHHQEAARRLEEIERLANLSQTQGDELETLRRELQARMNAHDEEQDFLERAQNEIEALRAELNARDDEIEQLRETINSPQTAVPRSLDDEMLSSIRQQHALELSSATSQIRALENTIFDKDSTIHALQKQVNVIEEQFSHLRSNSQLGQRQPSRPSSRVLDSDLRRSSFGSHRPNYPPPLSRTIFDHNMTPETLHKRKVSLSMLKARIESEVIASTSQPPSRALSPVHSEGYSRPSSVAATHHHRPQFLDESHVFWCHSCQGDLVIL